MTLETTNRLVRLVALTPAARAAGLRRGMTAAAARARVPGVALEALDPAGEHEDRCALRAAFTALSDRVSFPWDDELVLEISGVSRAFGGDEAVAERARALAEALGHACAVAVADHPLAAAALARTGPFAVLPPGEAGALAPLPLAAFRPSAPLRDALRAVGIARMGDFARLDPASVAGRFGAEGVALHRVGRGLAPPGTDLGWRDPMDPRPAVSARMGGATSTLQIHFALPGLLARLADRLAALDRVVARLEVVFRLEAGWGEGRERVAVGLRVGRPTRNPAVLERLIRQRIDGLCLPAPVDELILEVVESARDSGWQPGLTDRTEAAEPVPDLLARLADHLGEEACCAAELVDTWRPEGGWRPRAWPPSEPHPALPGIDPPGAIPAGARSDDPVEVQEAWDRTLSRPRPVELLPEPQPLQVRVGARGPAAIHLGERGWVRVARCRGPERIEGAWWDPELAWTRDYWVVEADGRVAWVFRDRARDRWALHGWF